MSIILTLKYYDNDDIQFKLKYSVFSDHWKMHLNLFCLKRKNEAREGNPLL